MEQRVLPHAGKLSLGASMSREMVVNHGMEAQAPIGPARGRAGASPFQLPRHKLPCPRANRKKK